MKGLNRAWKSLLGGYKSNLCSGQKADLEIHGLLEDI